MITVKCDLCSKDIKGVDIVELEFTREPMPCSIGFIYEKKQLCNTCATRLHNAIDAGSVKFNDKHGEWIYNPETLSTNSGYTCSVCKDPMWHAHDVKQAFKYCPNCGAKMDGETK